MKRSILLSLALVLILASTLSFAPVPTINAAPPQTFTATLVVWPDDRVEKVNRTNGDSDRQRTVVERYGGVIFDSNLGAINLFVPPFPWGPYIYYPYAGNVVMDITTNFEQTGGAFSGVFHSTLDITATTGNSKITLNVTGTITGQKNLLTDQITSATITGKFNSTGATGSLAGKHVNGTLDYKINIDAMGQNLGTLTGTIN